jgi:hypothetical protein
MTKRPFKLPSIRLPDFHPVEFIPVSNGSISNLLVIATGLSKTTLMIRSSTQTSSWCFVSDCQTAEYTFPFSS